MVLNRTNPLILQKSYSTVGHTVMNGAQCTGDGGGPKQRQPPICTGPKGPMQINSQFEVAVPLCPLSLSHTRTVHATGTSPRPPPGPRYSV